MLAHRRIESRLEFGQDGEDRLVARLRPAKLGYPRISIQVASEPNEDPRQLIVSSSTLSPQKLAEVSSPHFEAQRVWVFSQRSCHADYLPHIPARHAAVSDYAGVLPAGCVYSLTATRVWQLGPSAAPAPHPTRPRPRPAAAHRHWLREPRAAYWNSLRDRG